MLNDEYDVFDGWLLEAFEEACERDELDEFLFNPEEYTENLGEQYV